ncbi:MAG: glycosyltransferase family A protein [Desulfuromonadaceae bacterium]|nr:glycosyltransferase family A protein [Desulfuromonadaceae bacterium]
MISVIIPTYNSGKYICEALDSVLHQTYSDYEIIVIDDGSTDTTREIIKNRFQTVRYYYVENSGVSAARNLGISMAQGELIAFLDADDKWLPEKLEKQVALFNNNDKLGMVFTENSFFNEQGITMSKANKRERLMSGDIVRNIFLNSYVATPTVMVRKNVFDTVGLFEEGLIVAEDDNMWMRIGMGFRVELIDKPMVLCRITEGSLSRKNHNIYMGVKASIEIIKKKYPDLYNRLGMLAIRKKYSNLFFSEGYHYFSQGIQKEARSNFIKSYINDPFKLKTLLYMISTCFPQWVIVKIKDIKRKYNKEVMS